MNAGPAVVREQSHHGHKQAFGGSGKPDDCPGGKPLKGVDSLPIVVVEPKCDHPSLPKA